MLQDKNISTVLHTKKQPSSVRKQQLLQLRGFGKASVQPGQHPVP